MDSVYSRFDSYNFEADRRFQEGLRVLSANSSEEETKLLDMKLFFYNRFVEAIDQSGYKQRNSTSDHQSRAASLERDGAGDLRTGEAGSEEEEEQEEQEKEEQEQLTFAEVMRLVQEGKEVPGVSKVEVQPTNQSPTPSRMERVLKPWEASSASR